MLSRYDPVKRLALVACLVHTARMRARDDLAETPCERAAAKAKGPGRSWRRSGCASARSPSG
jgi:hypothetical protein